MGVAGPPLIGSLLWKPLEDGRDPVKTEECLRAVVDGEYEDDQDVARDQVARLLQMT